LKFRSKETDFGRLISSNCFLPIYLFEKVDNFDVVRELFNKVFVWEPFYNLVDLQDITGIEIVVDLFDSIQKRSYNIDVNRNRNDFKLFRLLDRRFLIS